MTFKKNLIDFFRDSPLDFMKTIPLESIVFDDRAKYMCKFGCKNYGRKYSCPPSSLKLRKKIDNNSYKWALVVATTYRIPKGSSRFMKRAYNNQKEMEIQRISAQLDDIMNLYSVDHITLSGGACKRCRRCSLLSNEKCKKPHLKQVSMEAIGIDCQKTFYFSGFDFKMPDDNSINRGAAVFHNEDEISDINLKKRESNQKFKLPTLKDSQKMTSWLLKEYPELYKTIEIKPISKLEINETLCNKKCPHYGKNFSCPPYSTPIDLNLWENFVLWKWNVNKTKKWSYNAALKKMHSAFFSLGYYFSLSLRDCYCNECKKCTFSIREKTFCSYRKLLSPSMQSQGIDPLNFGNGKYGIELI